MAKIIEIEAGGRTFHAESWRALAERLQIEMNIDYEAAKDAEEKPTQAGMPVPPQFTLRADRVGHLRALIAAAIEMPEAERASALQVLREFELYEEAHR